MLGLSANAITAINQNARTHIKIQFADSATVFDDSDVAFSGGFELDAPLNPDADLTMGRAVSSQVKVVFLNSANVALIDWTKAMTVSLGVEVGNDVEYCQLGVFTGEKPEKTQLVDKVTFTAYDNMCKFDVEAYPLLSGLNWAGGITVSSLLSQICSYVGVSLATLNSNYILSNIMGRTYTTNPFANNGYTCREIIAFIAEANCCYARINPAGELDLVWFDDSMYDTETISRNNWFSADVSEHNATISALKVYMTEDDVGVVMPSGTTDLTGNLYRIFDNPLLGTGDSADETAYITPIYNRLVNFGTYVPVSVSADGHWYLEARDIIKVESQSGTYIRMPIFNKRLNWNGTASEYYETTGNTKREPITQTNRKNMTYNGRLHEIKVTIDKNYELIQDQFGNYYTKSETATQITTQVSSAMGNYYTKTETDSQISTQMGTALGNYYTKTETASEVSILISNNATVQKMSSISVTNGKIDVASLSTDVVTSSNVDGYVNSNATVAKMSGISVSGGRIELSSLSTQVSTLTSNDVNNLINGNATVSKMAGIVIDSSGRINISSLSTSVSTLTSGDVNNLINNNSTVANKYTKQSGITITDSGISLTGSQYITMGSSGYVSINSWRFDQNGISYSSGGVTFNVDTEGTSGVGLYCSHPLLLMSSAAKPVAIYEYGDWTILGTKNIGNGNAQLSIGYWHQDVHEDPIRQIVARYLYYIDYFGRTSSRMYKHDIKSIEDVGDTIDKLRPVTFVYNYDKEGKTSTGFIYEEIVDVLPNVCNYSNGVYTVSDVALIPYMVKEIQSLRKRISKLESI